MSEDDARPEAAAHVPDDDTDNETETEVRVPDDEDDQTQPVKDLLAEHVPLALLVDLVAPESTSTEILEAEGLPEVAWWEPAPTEPEADPEP
ncbi:hypothetical protein ACPPVS_05935 [Cellulomonas sp. McL0617]|uniref:hypothetical protein n=1 Tax=Cellulomonas sp. McL0617 TaxID=3415675 RepID=UPI003CF7B8AA